MRIFRLESWDIFTSKCLIPMQCLNLRSLWYNQFKKKLIFENSRKFVLSTISLTFFRFSRGTSSINCHSIIDVIYTNVSSYIIIIEPTFDVSYPLLNHKIEIDRSLPIKSDQSQCFLSQSNWLIDVMWPYAMQ